MEQLNQPFDVSNIRDLLTVVFKHKRKIIITFLIIFIGATLVAFQSKRLYEAKSVLLVKFGREFMSRPEVGSGNPGLAVLPETIIRGEMSILTSRDLISKVIRTVGPENLRGNAHSTNKTGGGNITEEQQILKAFEENLSVTNVSGSSLIQVTFTHANPVVAAKVVNTLVDAFKEKHLEVFSADSTPFLQGQQKVFEKKLRESEANLAAFKQKNRVISFEEQRTALLGQRSALDTSLKAAQSQISELEQKIAFIKSSRWTTDVPPEIRAQMAVLQQKEREISEKYTENSTAMANLRRELQTAKELVRRNSEETRQIELGKTEGELSIARARADSLRRQLGQVDGETRMLDAQGRELGDLKREATQQEQAYQAYSKKLEESLIMDDMDRRKMVAISVVEQASSSMLPKRGKLGKKEIVGVGFFGGIGAGILLAFLLEFLSPCMTTPSNVEKRLKLPVLVSVPLKKSLPRY